MQFERESAGKDVLRWMRQKHGLKFTAVSVPVKKGTLILILIYTRLTMSRPKVLSLQKGWSLGTEL